MRYKISIGDWSNDGHGKYEDFIIESNVDYKEIIAAYKKACEASGVSLHEGKGTSKYTVLCSEYEQHAVPHDAFEKLATIGIKLMEFCDCDHTQPYDEAGEYTGYPSGFVQLFLAMAKTQLPDFKYGLVDDDIITINQTDGFREFMGYGLFY